ncbi:unnamed protein product, partial [Urochloa humidicola]
CKPARWWDAWACWVVARRLSPSSRQPSRWGRRYIHLCKKCTKALKLDIQELREKLRTAEHPPEAAAEARALQLSLVAGPGHPRKGFKGFLHRICNAAQDLEDLDHADQDICSAIRSLLAKSGDAAPNESYEVMERFYMDYYARRKRRRIWSVLSKVKPSVATDDRQRGIRLVSPPPSQAAPPGRSTRTTRRRRARRVPNALVALQAIFMGTRWSHYWSLLQKEAAQEDEVGMPPLVISRA